MDRLPGISGNYASGPAPSPIDLVFAHKGASGFIMRASRDEIRRYEAGALVAVERIAEQTAGETTIDVIRGAALLDRVLTDEETAVTSAILMEQ